MGTNREIKSDGSVIIKGLTYPSADGSDGQVIKTNGAGVLSFVDQSGAGGGSVDTIASASDASSYSGTNRIIHVTSTDDVTFTTDLIGRVIIVAGSLSGGSTVAPKVTIQNCHMIGCILRSSGNLDFKNTSTDGSSFTAFRNNTISANFITVSASGNTSGNTLQIQNSNITCNRFTINTVSNDVVAIDRNKIFAGQFFEAGTSSVDDVSLQDCHINTGDFKGYYNLSSGSNNHIIASEGTGDTLSLKINSETFINSVYNEPFIISKQGVDTKVVARASNSGTVTNISTSTSQMSFDTVAINTAGSFSSSTFTCAVKGFYNVTYHTRFASVGSGEFVEVMIRKNGVTERTGILANDTSINTTIVSAGDTLLMSLDVGDTVGVFAAASASGINFDGNSSHFQINKIN